ncbi:M48 family metallopeptidase [Alicyclobacillus sp. SO9]|uniref:M48 family metallopeptidase n=1 Tax=Alicyclobacillus sp. SO9 TaxID=2665646 RepID=UPI0018E77A1E|nr:M48 family metalloprotease [Alicyclobacillus sp. SO9]QQE80456.1 M48 family metalloprotease [Alicyclobacillus sp. SO9]
MNVDTQSQRFDLFKRRRSADVRKWMIYLIMWVGIVVFGAWVGWKFGRVRIGLIVSGSVIIIGLFYSVFILGGHVKASVNSSEDPSHMGISRIRRLLHPLCSQTGLAMPTIFIMPTDAPNACAVGIFSKSQSIGVTEGALNMLTDEELSAVLAHEVTHLQRKDIFFDGWWIALTGMAVSLSAVVVGMGIASLLAARRAETKKQAESAEGWGVLLIGLGIIVGIVGVVILQLIQHVVMRRAEYMADHGAVLLTGRARPLMLALEKMEVADSLFQAPSMLSMVFSVSAVPRSHWGQRWFDTHPPTRKRVKRLEKIGRTLGEF